MGNTKYSNTQYRNSVMNVMSYIKPIILGAIVLGQVACSKASDPTGNGGVTPKPTNKVDTVYITKLYNENLIQTLYVPATLSVSRNRYFEL